MPVSVARPALAAAQQQPTPTPTPTPTPEPSAATPTPVPTPDPAPAIVPPVVIAIPAPVSTPRAPARPTPSARPTPTPTPTPATAPAIIAPSPPTPNAAPSATPATPTPTPVPSPGPTAPSITTTVIQPAAPAPASPWPLALAALAGLLLLGAGWAALRRRGAQPVSEPEPELVTLPAPRAALTLELRPIRAGINLISATVEAEVTITNTGDAPATGVRAELKLFSAHAGQDAELAAFHAAGPTRPTRPPVTLAPGEPFRFRATNALPHGAIQPLDAGGRPMFVPVLALAIRFGDADGERRAGQAWAIGIERVDSARLAPFWLDAPARAYDTLAARAQGPAVEG